MRIPRITLAPVWLVLPALLTLMYACTRVAYPLDFWHQVATGHLIWQSGSLPTHDTFTYTIAGQPIVNQNWLAQAAFFRLFDLGGFELVQFLTGLCYATALLVITGLAWHRCRSVHIAAGLAIGALALAVSNLTVRPQALSVLLFAVELYVLYRWPGRWWTVAVVACVEVLWTNTHGAFPLGIVLPGMFLVASGWKTWREQGGRALAADGATRVYLACVLVGLAAMFCNPHPDKTLQYVFGVVSRAPQRQIGEWLPTATGSHTAVAFSLSLAAVLAVLGLSRKRLEPVDLLLLISFVILANRAQRMVLWWGLVMAAVLAPQLAALLASWKRDRADATAPEDQRSPWSFAMLLFLIGTTGMCTPWTRRYNPLLPAGKRQEFADDEPRQVVRFLKETGYRGRVFCPMEWGAYFTWFLSPHAKVFVDTRVDFFPDEIWEQYVHVGKGHRDWENILAQYDVNMVVWNRQWSGDLPAVLEESARWKRVHEDPLSTAFGCGDDVLSAQPGNLRHSARRAD